MNKMIEPTRKHNGGYIGKGETEKFSAKIDSGGSF